MLKERIQKQSDIIGNKKNKAKVRVKTDADCELRRGNELIATLQAGKENLIYISGGKYDVEACSSEFPYISQKVPIEINNVSFEYDFEVKLANKIKRRRKYLNTELQEWLKRYKIEFTIFLLAVAGFFVGVWVSEPEDYVHETFGADYKETHAVVETPATEVKEENRIDEEEVQRQAEIERQQAKERKIKEEQERKRQEEERKRQAEEKEKQDEKKFNEYKAKGDEYYLLLVGSPDNKSYKDQAKYYYGLALQYKEDAKIRNRFENLKK